MKEHTVQIKAMEIGERLTFPKEMRNKIEGVSRKEYCHGRYYVVTSKKKDDYLTIMRVE